MAFNSLTFVILLLNWFFILNNVVALPLVDECASSDLAPVPDLFKYMRSELLHEKKNYTTDDFLYCFDDIQRFHRLVQLLLTEIIHIDYPNEANLTLLCELHKFSIPNIIEKGKVDNLGNLFCMTHQTSMDLGEHMKQLYLTFSTKLTISPTQKNEDYYNQLFNNFHSFDQIYAHFIIPSEKGRKLKDPSQN